MYRRKSSGWLKHWDFLLLDMIMLQVCFWLACAIGPHIVNPYASGLYRNVAIMIELADLVVMFSFGTLNNVLKRGYYKEFWITIQHTMIVTAIAVFYLFILQWGQNYSRSSLLLMVIFYAVFGYIFRILWKKLLYQKHTYKTVKRSMIVAASSDMIEKTLAKLKANSFGNYKITGVVLLDGSDSAENVTGGNVKILGIPVVSDMMGLPMYVCQNWVDEVMIFTMQDHPYQSELIERLEETGVTVHVSLENIADRSGKKQFVETVGGYTVLTTSINYASTKQMAAKRLMDIAGGIVGCIATGILFIFVAPAIYIASPGPIFFSQERIGLNGKKFKIYKFRSMYMDAEARKAELMKDNRISDGKMFKLEFDPRVIGNRIMPDGTKKTGIGDFIRRSSIDEFPQFFNVLKGDMSLVGTRPPLPSETNLYDLHHRSRLSIKPGITGMWQVSGRSDITDFEEVVRLDREYITEWSIGMDIKILLKTVGVIFKKDGSM